MIAFTLTLLPSLFPKLKGLAKKEGRSLSRVIENAGMAYVERHALLRHRGEFKRKPGARVLRHYVFSEEFDELLDRCAARGFVRAWIIEEAIKEAVNGKT